MEIRIFIFILACCFRKAETSKPAKLTLIKYDGTRLDITGRVCKAGIYLAKPTKFKCACVDGLWGFYTSFCKRPFLFVGGDSYCFCLKRTITQVIPFGNPRYPFEPSITHFRDGFDLMTRPYFVDDGTLDLDAASSFVTITDRYWTLTGNREEKLCLNSSVPDSTTKSYCLFDHVKGLLKWTGISELRRGCTSTNVLNAEKCFPFRPPSKLDRCMDEDPFAPVTTTMRPTIQTTTIKTTTLASTEFTTTFPPNLTTTTEFQVENSTTTSTPETTTISTTEPTVTTTETSTSTETTTTTEETTTETTTTTTTTTTERPPCIIPERENVKRFHPENCQQKSPCSRSLTEISLADDLMRFASYEMNQVLKTSQNSLRQIKEIFEIHLKIMKTTCSEKYLTGEFIDAVTENFLNLINEDFSYGVEEFEASLFERVMYSLRRCLKGAEGFEFVSVPGPCNSTKTLPKLILDDEIHGLSVSERESWRNYELLIESGWKLFLNAHSYCYRHFYRLNDHHSYSHKIMEIFSTSIYEKWNQPLKSRYLYKLLLPSGNLMDTLLDNMDNCVAAVTFVSPCPVWLDRSGNRVAAKNTALEIRKKRNIWESYFEEHREDTDIWKGKAFCLQNAEDPSYHLNFGRCSHP